MHLWWLVVWSVLCGLFLSAFVVCASVCVWRLTCPVDVLVDVHVMGVHQPLLHVHLSVSVVIGLVVSVVLVASIQVSSFTAGRGASSSALASVAARHRHSDVNGLMVCGRQTAVFYLESLFIIVLKTFFLRQTN